MVVQILRFEQIFREGTDGVATVGVRKFFNKVKFHDCLVLPRQHDDYSLGKKDNSLCCNLIGLVFHEGGSAHSGHYTAAIKDSEKWYYADDDKPAVEVPLSDLFDKNSSVLHQKGNSNNIGDIYLLFYKFDEDPTIG